MINSFNVLFHLDQNDRGGDIILYIRENVPSRLVTTVYSPVEDFFVEINSSPAKVATMLLLESKERFNPTTYICIRVKVPMYSSQDMTTYFFLSNINGFQPTTA